MKNKIGRRKRKNKEYEIYKKKKCQFQMNSMEHIVENEKDGNQ